MSRESTRKEGTFTLREGAEGPGEDSLEECFGER